MEDGDKVQDGDDVILRKESSVHLFTIKATKQFWVEKTKFSFQGALGHPYGTRFNLVDHQLVKAAPEDKGDDEEADCGSGDNRNLQDVGLGNQKLSADDIDSMKREGVSGEGIVEKLVENSETFDSKSEFSKEKYIRKKKKKHVPVYTILKPNYRLMFEFYQRRGKNKLNWVREDGLAQLLCQGNVRAGGRYLVVDGIDGLLTGAVLYRLGRQGTEADGHIIEFFTGQQPGKLQGLWPRSHYLDHVYSVPTNRVDQLRYAVLGGQALPSTTRRRDPPPSRPVSDGAPALATSGQTVTESVLAQPAARPESAHHESDTITKFRCTPCDPGCYSKKHKGENGATHGNPDHHGNPFEAHDVTDGPEQKEEGKRKEAPSDEAGEGSWKQRRFDQAVKMLTSQKMDGLFIACRAYPLPLLTDLVDFLAPSRQVVVYTPYQEVLMMCYKAMRESSQFINVNVSETWLRDYQVLPKRTHPTINMSGGGGYLLTATTVHKE